MEGAVAQLRGAGVAEAAGDPSPDAAAEVAELRERLATAQAEAAAAAGQRDSLQHEAAQLRSQVLHACNDPEILLYCYFQPLKRGTFQQQLDSLQHEAVYLRSQVNNCNARVAPAEIGSLGVQ